MSYTSNPRLTRNSQTLRKGMTKEERHLWYDFLKRLSIPFHRQKTIGLYIVDFYCDQARLIIELDGETGIVEDQERDSVLNSMGYTVLRFPNSEIHQNFEGVCAEILKYLPDKRFRDI